jgi:hypothetical protein
MIRKILLVVFVLILIVLILVPLCITVPKTDTDTNTAANINTNIDSNNKDGDTLTIISRNKNSVTGVYSNRIGTWLLMSDIPVTAEQEYVDSNPLSCTQQEIGMDFDLKMTIENVTPYPSGGYCVKFFITGNINARIGNATLCKTGHGTIQKRLTFKNADGNVIDTKNVSADVWFTSSSVEIFADIICPSNIAVVPRPDCCDIHLSTSEFETSSLMDNGGHYLHGTDDGYLIDISDYIITVPRDSYWAARGCEVFFLVQITEPDGTVHKGYTTPSTTIFPKNTIRQIFINEVTWNGKTWTLDPPTINNNKLVCR